MNSHEKFEKMLSLEAYHSRDEIPVCPMMLTTVGTIAGMTQKEICENIDNWLTALDKTIARIGHPDALMPTCPGDTIFTMGLPVKKPGVELDDQALYQFIEKPYFDDPSEYKKIYDMGWNNWYFSYMADIQNPKMTMQEVGARYHLVGENLGKSFRYLYQNGIEPEAHAFIYPIYDNLSLIRSMGEFACDMYEDAGPIMDIIHKYQPFDDEQNIQRIKATRGTRVWNAAMRSSAVFASPALFDEYIWPNMKAMILRYYEAGIQTVLHADANWLPMLMHFTEVPRGSMLIELDGAADIFAAYDILQGYQAIRGDVPTTMFAYSSPEEVSEYCDKLIAMGMNGGFMLASGCEIPLNAKIENIKAMMDSVKSK